MKFWKDPSGLFYYHGSIINLVRKPRNVVRYIIYQSVDPLQIALAKGPIYNFTNGEILEVVLEDNLERIFFEFKDGVFQRKFFPTIKPQFEGEAEIGYHLGIYHL